MQGDYIKIYIRKTICLGSGDTQIRLEHIMNTTMIVYHLKSLINIHNAGKLLGFSDFIPPFATATVTEDILNGVNYASGVAGIRDETGLQYV